MRKLLLLSALLIFACSSDESSNNDQNSNQTFLERYADIVWESIEEEGIRTSLNLNGFIRKGEECLIYTWGEENSSNGLTWNLLENNYDSLVVNLEENGLIDFTSVITVSEDGNTITEFISDDEIFNASRTSLSNPCE